MRMPLPIRPRCTIRLALGVAALLFLSVPAAAAVTPCSGGLAGVFPCSNVDLLSHLPLATLGAGFGNDVWGWTDPVTGGEYVILGLSQGTAFVDISDPENPIQLGLLPSVPGGSFWSDMKTYGDHAYIVSEAAGFELAIFDLTQLRTVVAPPVVFTRTATYAGFSTAHNVVIDEQTGFAYIVGSNTCSGGLHILDLTNPLTPLQVGCYTDDGYTHDSECLVYQGPDLAHAGKEICFNLNASSGVLAIVDVTSKIAPVTLSLTGYPGSDYTHHGWLTEDQRHFLLGDEDDEIAAGHGTRTYVFDVADLDAPVFTGHHTASYLATDHNHYIVGDHVYQANYAAGLRVLRTGNLALAQLGQVAYFDTFPPHDAATTDLGAWSVYPFLASGTVVVSDIATGLFVLRPDLDAVTRCQDGLDNDGDGLTDYGGDPGCQNKLAFAKEDPECLDGADNDFDGDTDFPLDDACRSAFDDDEATDPACGLGFELAPLLALWGLRRRTR